MKHPRTRAERRANQQAVDAVTKRMMADWGFTDTWHKFRHQRQPCSCPGCGNIRTWEGPTLQERRHEFKLSEGLDEIFFASDEDRILIDIERCEQTALMNAYPDALRAALDFVCRRVNGYDDWESSYVDWYANGKLVAMSYIYSDLIDVRPKYHEFVWDAFNLFF